MIDLQVIRYVRLGTPADAAGAQGLGGRAALEEGGAQPEREQHLDETHGVSD